MERSLANFASLLLLLVLPACKPKEWTAPSRPAPPESGTPIFINVSVIHQDTDLRRTQEWLLEHRFAAISGRTSTFDEYNMHISLTPRANGNGTINITATWREDFLPDTRIVRHIPGITVVDGRKTTHQVHHHFFTFIATTDPKYFPATDLLPRQLPWVLPHNTPDYMPRPYF